MIDKPKNSTLFVVRIYFAFIALALILAMPLSANAEVLKLAFSPLFSAINDYQFANTSIHSSILTSDSSNTQTDAPEDLDKASRLDAYFEKRNMPLAGYGIEFVRAANKYDIDWRLIAAIGVRESSGGKHMMNNNPFGWGSARIKFADFSEAIDVVTSNLGGFNPSTARYYKDADIDKKLWYYNGSVIHSYPGEVKAIMEMF